MLSWNRRSQTAKSIADSVGGVLLGRNTHFPSKKLVINYGHAKPYNVVDVRAFKSDTRFINFGQDVKLVGNKLLTFRRLQNVLGVNIPEFTESRDTAFSWIQSGSIVLGRGEIRGSAGRGITVHRSTNCASVNDLPSVPLFVKYIRKQKEFRVHVFNGQIVDVQEKRRTRNVERDQDDKLIRSHLRGWTFCRQDIVEPEGLREQALAAVSAFEGLDFAGVDIIWNERENRCYVLEINTAPGMEGTTLNNYVNLFKTEAEKVNRHETTVRGF